MTPDVLARFERKFIAEPTSGCWLWTEHLGSSGYGTISVNGRSTLAHRTSFQHFVGPIPEGLHLDHLCRTKCCVNPAHLEPVTLSENVRRDWKFRTPTMHCRNGHPFTPENTGFHHGARRCLTCHRESERRRRRRNRDQSPMREKT